MGLRILLSKADMGYEEADVIVNSTNPNLDLHRGQLSKALLERAGPPLQKSCRERYPDGINIGDIAVTSAGVLKWVEEIYHCVLPRWEEDTGPQTFVSMLTKLLTTVDETGWKTLAIPALGTGRLAYPRDLIAELMFTTVDKFAKEHPDTSINDVLFVLHPSDSESIKSYEAEYRKYVTARGGHLSPDMDEYNAQEVERYREQQMSNIKERAAENRRS